MMKRILGNAKRAWTTRVVPAISPRYKLNHRNSGLINFIDIGSVDGLPEPWDQNANLVKFLLNFEPNDQPSRTANSLTYNTAVWEADEERDFYIYKGFHGTGSSLFKQNFNYVRENYESLKQRGPAHLAETWFERSELVRQEKLKCRSMDNVLQQEFPSERFHFMKVDAQGAEYQILRGSEKFLSESCVGLHLELFTLPLYHDIKLLDEVENYLKSFNFVKVKTFPPHGTFNSQNDCLFLKAGSTADEIVSAIKKVYGI